MDKDIIDVQAREKPKFLTGTPHWMNGPLGLVYGAVIIVFAVLAIIDWFK